MKLCHGNQQQPSFEAMKLRSSESLLTTCCVFICLHPSLFGIAHLTDVSWKLPEKALLWCLIDFGLFIMKASFDVALLFGLRYKNLLLSVSNLPLAHVTSSCSRAFVDAFAMTMTDKSSPSVLTIDNFQNLHLSLSTSKSLWQNISYNFPASHHIHHLVGWVWNFSLAPSSASLRHPHLLRFLYSQSARKLSLSIYIPEYISLTRVVPSWQSLQLRSSLECWPKLQPILE